MVPAAFARAQAEKKAGSAVARHRLVGRVHRNGPHNDRDPHVAALIEERFVAVRARWRSPADINERYNLGGWPTTVFLTTAGEVLTGGRILMQGGWLRRCARSPTRIATGRRNQRPRVTARRVRFNRI